MTGDRWVVLGLAHPRASWSRELARWSTSAAVPVDFVKCVSPDEVRARLASGRAFSALLVGGGVPGFDRDLVDQALAVGTTTVAVDPIGDRSWAELGVAASLPATFDRADLLAALRGHARQVARIQPHPGTDDAEPECGFRGRLIAVTGPGGTGVSVTAMAVAQAFAAEPSNASMVLLADLSLDAEQAMLHDSRQLVPGVQELTEAHRAGRLPNDETRSMAFAAEGRGYHLLHGLRRHRDWVAIRPRAFAAALDGMLRAFRIVVADIDADLEGEELTGSHDIEDRNVLARTVLPRADVVVTVGHPSTKGIHSLSRTVRELIAGGIDPARILPAMTRAARSPRQRAGAVAAFAGLVGPETVATAVGNPVFVPERRDVDSALRDGIRLPAALSRPLQPEVVRMLEELDTNRPDGSGLVEPEPVAAGSLGRWSEEVE